jgi:hypothetical protein
MADNKIYSATGNDLQAAVLAAHEKYVKANPAEPSDVFITKVVTLGVESGGFLLNTIFVAQVQESEHIPIDP